MCQVQNHLFFEVPPAPHLQTKVVAAGFEEREEGGALEIEKPEEIGLHVREIIVRRVCAKDFK